MKICFMELNMTENRVLVYCLTIALCLSIASGASEKQIKLEDIEKDTLKAAQQAKLEKQIQNQRQQQQIPYQQQYGTQLAYQTPTSYFQYVVPQQDVVPQTHSQYIPVADYAALATKNLALTYTPPFNQAYQMYLSPQLGSVSSHFSGYQPGQSVESVAQTQPIIMALALPQHHQQYYHGGLQYYPSQIDQGNHIYYAPQIADQRPSYTYPASGQQYLTSYQSVTHGKGPGYSQYLTAISPGSPATSSFPLHQGHFASLYSPSSAQVYTNTESPIFVTMKAPKHLVASTGQKQQFAQMQTTTLSPLQTKYLNSPQYLAQNYNTIQSSQLYAKGPLSSGVKSTASPIFKTPLVTASAGTGSSPFISASLASSSNTVPTYQSFKSIPLKSYSI